MSDPQYGRDDAREIVGGGFGRVYAALEPEKLLGRELKADMEDFMDSLNVNEQKRILD